MGILETGIDVIKVAQALAQNPELVQAFQASPEAVVKQILGDTVADGDITAVVNGVKLELSAQGLLNQAVTVAENVGEELMELLKKVEKVVGEEAATLVNQLSPGFSGKASEVERIVVTQFADMFTKIKAVFTDAGKPE